MNVASAGNREDVDNYVDKHILIYNAHIHILNNLADYKIKL